MPQITKAVIPVAGSGSRLMPLTMHQPKALVGVADKPILHYLIEELVQSGIQEIVIVHRPHQGAILKYIDYLEDHFAHEKINVTLRPVAAPHTKSSIDSLLYAEEALGGEPFLLCFGDDLLADDAPPSKAVIDAFAAFQQPIIGLQQVPNEHLHHYGVCQVTHERNDVYRITKFVDKPHPSEAPSNFAGVARYALPSTIFDYCRKAKNALDQKKEVSIVDVLTLYLQEGNEAYGSLIKGKYFDGGSHIGLLKAQMHYGLKHPIFGDELRRFLEEQ